MTNRLSKRLPSYYRKRREYRREIFGWLHAAFRRSETIDVLFLPTPTPRMVEKRLIAQYKAIGQARWKEAR
jgi:hypothetical protein